MKFRIIFILLIFSRFHVTASNNPPFTFLVFADTVNQLEKKIHENIKMIAKQIDEDNSHLQELMNQSSIAGIEKKKLKLLQKEISTIQNQLQFNNKKQNAYLRILTVLHKLKIQHESVANKQLEDINIALLNLNRNKLPGVFNLDDISSTSFIRDQTDVYNTEIISPCNMNRSPDGKLVANEFETLFTHTDSALTSFFKESDFLQCQTRFIKTKDDYILEFNFILNSSKAAALYGSIDASSPIKIDFMNGSYIYLETHAVTNAKSDYQNGTTSFQVEYKLDREDIKNISKNEVDTITIVWTTGVDIYQICKMDLLRNLFECIQKRKLQN